MTVKQLLGVLDPDMKVDVVITAYGIYYGSSLADDLETVKDCMEHLNATAYFAKVDCCTEKTWSNGHRLVIRAEVCK